MVGSFLIGLGLAVLFNLKTIFKRKEKKNFVCGHCQSENTLQMQKLREKDIFTCSFCERILDEDQLKVFYPDAYEAVKKAGKEEPQIEDPSQEDNK